VLSLVLVASDWPIGWSFWVLHPFMSALVPGLLLIAIAGVLVDALLQRRERRHWRAVGGAVAGEFNGLFADASNVLFSILGDEYARTNAEIDYHLVPTQRRAREVLQLDGTPPDAWDPDQPIGGLYDDRARSRLPILMRDELWVDGAFGSLRTVTTQHGRLLAQWASLSAVAGREQEFRHLGHSTLLADTINRFLVETLLVQTATLDEMSPLEAGEADHAIARAVDLWTELRVLCVDEIEFWSGALGDRAGIHSGRRLLDEALRRMRS
jgi:hypothetical protein